MFFSSYISTYVERDVHQLLKIKDAALFTTFLKLLVGRIGSILDITSISNDCGISTKTVTEWLSILHTSYICFLLPPWYENRGKRTPFTAVKRSLLPRRKVFRHSTTLNGAQE